MKQNERILFLAQLPPPVHGMSVVNQLIFQSELISKEFTVKFIDLSLSKSISGIGQFSVSKIVRLLFFFPKVAFHLLVFRPKIVYFTLSPSGPALYRDTLLGLVVQAFRIPLVIHMHGKGLRLIPAGSLKETLVRLTFRNNFVISLSEGLKKDVAHLPFREIFTVANGIRRTSVATKGKFAHKRVHFIFLSNLVKSKGILDLIEAFSLVMNSSSEWRLSIVGNDGDVTTMELEHLVSKKGLSRNIEILGPRYGDEKTDQLNQADVLVFPTYYYNECFPLVILESMMHGLAVVSTFEGAIPEIITHGRTGLLVNSQNPKELSSALLMLITDVEMMKRMGRQGASDFQINYTSDIFETRLRDVFKNVISKIN